MLALFVTISEILAMEMFITLTLECAKVKYEYMLFESPCHFLFDGNSNVCSVCRCLWDNHYKRPKRTPFTSLTFKRLVNIMKYNVTKYNVTNHVIGWQCIWLAQYNLAKRSQNIEYSTYEIYTWIHILYISDIAQYICQVISLIYLFRPKKLWFL